MSATGPSKFRRLASTHAAMTAGDAAMVVALADSLFFSIDPSEARSKVLLFLVVSFTPFLLIAPLIGPVIDRTAGGRRVVIQVVAATRLVLALLLARYVDSLALFPLVFAALVLQKSYVVSKSALIPSVVRNESELVEANSKLGVIAGLVGFVAVMPAGLLQLTIGPTATLVYGAALFAAGLVFASALAPDRVASNEPEQLQRLQLRVPRLQLAAVAMTMLRCAVGFMFFHLAFWLRDQGDGGTTLFGLAVGLSAVAIMGGNSVAPRVRSLVSEENMLIGALALLTAVAVLAALFGGVVSGIALAMTVNLAASIGRLGFEAIVQQETPISSHGRAFAVFETRFQLGWVIAGVVPVVISIPGQIGFLIAGVVSALALVNYFAGVHTVSTRAVAMRRAIAARAAGRRNPLRQRSTGSTPRTLPPPSGGERRPPAPRHARERGQRARHPRGPQGP